MTAGRAGPPWMAPQIPRRYVSANRLKGGSARARARASDRSSPRSSEASCGVPPGVGAHSKRPAAIANGPETFATAFTTTTTGWVLTRNAGGDYVIDATVDGGYHWSQQLAVPPSSAG